MTRIRRALAATLIVTLAAACASRSSASYDALWSPSADAPRTIRQGDAAQDTAAKPAAPAAAPAKAADGDNSAAALQPDVHRMALRAPINSLP